MLFLFSPLHFINGSPSHTKSSLVKYDIPPPPPPKIVLFFLICQYGSPMCACCVQGFLLESHGGQVVLWNTETWVKVQNFVGHRDRVEAVQLKIYNNTLPTGMVLSCSKDKTIKYWDIRRYTEYGPYQYLFHCLNTCCF